MKYDDTKEKDVINCKIDKTLNKEFRHAVYLKYGLHKGDLQIAYAEAFKLWITANIGKK